MALTFRNYYIRQNHRILNQQQEQNLYILCKSSWKEGQAQNIREIQYTW